MKAENKPTVTHRQGAKSWLERLESATQSFNFFVGLGKLILPQRPVRPGLIAIKQMRFQGGVYV